MYIIIENFSSLRTSCISIINPKLLVTYVYPETNVLNSNTKLNVIYDCVDEVSVSDNDEGHYECYLCIKDWELCDGQCNLHLEKPSDILELLKKRGGN